MAFARVLARGVPVEGHHPVAAARLGRVAAVEIGHLLQVAHRSGAVYLAGLDLHFAQARGPAIGGHRLEAVEGRAFGPHPAVDEGLAGQLGELGIEARHGAGPQARAGIGLGRAEAGGHTGAQIGRVAGHRRVAQHRRQLLAPAGVLGAGIARVDLGRAGHRAAGVAVDLPVVAQQPQGGDVGGQIALEHHPAQHHHRLREASAIRLPRSAAMHRASPHRPPPTRPPTRRPLASASAHMPASALAPTVRAQPLSQMGMLAPPRT